MRTRTHRSRTRKSVSIPESVELLGGLEHRPRARAERERGHRPFRDEPLTKCGLPDRERRFEGLAGCHGRENVLDRIGQGVGRTRDERLSPVHGRASGRGSAAVRGGGDVAAVLAQHPEPEPTRRGDAGQDDALPRRGDELGVGVEGRNPPTPYTNESPRVEGRLDAPAGVSGPDQGRRARDAARGIHGVAQRAQLRRRERIHRAMVAEPVAAWRRAGTECG